MTEEAKVVFPPSMRDIYPAAAQQLYIETYKQSWAESAKGTSTQLSLEGVAARDAWDAVRREFEQDSTTHKWFRNGEIAAAQVSHAEQGSLLKTIKHLFRR